VHKISAPYDLDATLDDTVFILFVLCMAARGDRSFGGKCCLHLQVDVIPNSGW